MYLGIRKRMKNGIWCHERCHIRLQGLEWEGRNRLVDMLVENQTANSLANPEIIRQFETRYSSRKMNSEESELTGLGSYTHCRNPAVAVPLSFLPTLLHFSVTFSLNGTNTVSVFARRTDNPSALSSGNETHLASENIFTD